MSSNLIVYIAAAGLCAGLIFIIVFLYHRIRKLLSLFTSRKYPAPTLIASLRNLILIILWVSAFGMLLFMGFFMRAYHRFTLEKPVAKIEVAPLPQSKTMKITLSPINGEDFGGEASFVIKGDQWVLEGDILKWDNWLNFLGFDTRYRFTRIRGRYIVTRDEIQQESTLFSLVEDEDHPVWSYLYQYGQRFPFVSSVYGNAVFQYGNKKRQFLVYVTSSGFSAREVENRQG